MTDFGIQKSFEYARFRRYDTLPDVRVEEIEAELILGKSSMKFNYKHLLASLLLFCATLSAQSQNSSHPLTSEQATELKTYIHSAWQTLTRTQSDCRSLADPKLTTKPVLYVRADLELPSVVQEIERKCGVRGSKLLRVICNMGDVKVSAVAP